MLQLTIYVRIQVTPEICRELRNSRNRGDKEDDLMSIYILFFLQRFIVFSFQILNYSHAYVPSSFFIL